MRNNNQFNSSYTDNKPLKDITGKELSTNDFTNTLKTKLDGVQDGAQVNVRADWNATSGDNEILNKPKIPTSTLDLNDATNRRYVTDANLATIGNQSGTNTGDNATNSQYSGLASSKQDTLTLTTTGTSGAATLVGATLNIPQYTGGGGGGTSPFTNLGVGTTGTIVTGVTTNTITQSISIPANTLAANNTLDVIARFTKTGSVGSGTYRMYINTTNSITGATLIATLPVIAGGSVIITQQATRTFFYNGTNLTNNVNATSGTNTDMTTSTTTQASISYTSSVAYFLIFAIQLSNGADNSVINGYRVIKYA